MHRDRSLLRRVGLGGALAAGAAASACCFGSALPAAQAQVIQPGMAAAQSPVGTTPAAGTPQLARTGSTEQIRQLVQCGNTMYAVGTFTEIQKGSQTYARNNGFAFLATAPYTVTNWNPDTNGTINSVALSADCQDAYIGGQFSTVNGGVAASNIAEVTAGSGSINHAFLHNANHPVNTVLLTPNGHLLVGGLFTNINGSNADSFYVSLNPTTGSNDGYLSLNLSGNYVYPGVVANTTEIYNQQLSPDGQHVLAEGVFTKVQSNARQQIFMLNLSAAHGNVSDWYSSEFNGFCNVNHPLYIKAAAWSPDGSTVYIADTGYHPDTWSIKNPTFPLTGLCDSVSSFPATRVGGLTHNWTNYDGCFTLLSVAADSSTVYTGGHQEFMNSQNSCKTKGTPGTPDQGLAGVNASTGNVLLNSAGTAGLYSRSRGLGADDMLITSAGLWIASDNLGGSAMCDGVFGHAGICFLPYS